MKCKVVIIIFFMCFAIVCLTGCFQLNIDIGIDEWYRSYISYNIVLDVSDIDPIYRDTLSAAMNRLGWHYQQELGFTVGVITDGDEYVLTMRKNAADESLSGAYQSLNKMLTDENMSLFTQSDMQFRSFARRDSYIIDAALDIGHIISLSGYDGLPRELQDAFINGINTSTGVITLTLPASEVDEHSHDIDKQPRSVVMAVPVDFSGQTWFMLQGSVIYDDLRVQTGSTDEVTAGLYRTGLTFLAVCGGALLLLLIILLVKAIRVYKHNRLFGDD